MGLSAYKKYGAAASRLAGALKSGTVSHAYIFEGDNNIDKTGFAKAFAQALVCRQMPGEGCGRCAACRKIADGNYEDLYIVEPEDTTSRKTGTSSVKDAQIEELQVRLKSKPTAGPRNMAIIAGGDTMTTRAQTRFLKTLEEPPEGTVIMILSENSDELLPTINSRCVNVRLYDLEGRDASTGTETAKRIFSLISSKAYFADIKSVLDSSIKSRQDAYELLDALEALIGSTARGKQDIRISPDAARESTELIEETRRDIKLGAGYNYRVRGLMLRMEELI